LEQLEDERDEENEDMEGVDEDELLLLHPEGTENQETDADGSSRLTRMRKNRNKKSRIRRTAKARTKKLKLRARKW